MNFIGGSDSFRYFKIISVNNKKVKDEGRYKTKSSPGDAAKKAFTQLSKKYKTNKLTFSIKETTQGSTKKEHGPYLGEKIKLKKPLTVKYTGKNGKNKPVIIKYETKIHLIKDNKQKGGVVTNIICSVTGNELNKDKIPKHRCWICSQLPRKQIKDQYFKDSKTSFLNPCIDRDFFTTGNHEGHPIGYYHCKSDIWICYNCKEMFNIDFRENLDEIRDKIMNQDEESLSKVFKFIGFICVALFCVLKLLAFFFAKYLS